MTEQRPLLVWDNSFATLTKVVYSTSFETRRVAVLMRSWKTKEGATRVELVTSRSAVECSATELYPQIQTVLFTSVWMSMYFCIATCNKRQIDMLQWPRCCNLVTLLRYKGSLRGLCQNALKITTNCFYYMSLSLCLKCFSLKNMLQPKQPMA